MRICFSFLFFVFSVGWGCKSKGGHVCFNGYIRSYYYYCYYNIIRDGIWVGWVGWDQHPCTHL